MDVEQLSHSFFTLDFFLLLVTCRPAEGHSQVIGSRHPIVAAPGDDVVLPCHVEPPVNVVKLTVEWSKPDLLPDPEDRLSRVEYVHLYRGTHEIPDMKLPSYVRRTALFTDGLRQGNISLKIINVTLADEGRYRCFIPKLQSPMQSSIVRLIVETPQPNLQTPDVKEENDKGGSSIQSILIPAVVACVLLMTVLVAVGVTGYLTNKCRKQNLIQVPVV